MNPMVAIGLFIPALLLAPEQAQAQQPGPANMSFFVTSANPGQGGDLGGLAGADAYCQRLAQAAGAGGRSWRAYLSTQGAGAVNARDRIGRGPWRNAKGEVVANDVQQLHGQNNLTLQTALNERGEVVNGRRQQPNNHDVLTGSQPDGTAFSSAEDRTCRNWTSGGEGSAFVGHHDREGLRDDDASRSWNSSHASRGCGLEALRTTGGAGLLYCFAAD
ncbi:hypothetical protein [Belnapia rosea]|uniref:hypothetical protein n=1 Tax=Belnapia rosea TaxID=938405 RepID=UPI000883D222|nr:hypothetical protein [Belnapia rosea]SDB74739.1 hypothetical protein SAMN02927895_05441 [Belnapia rosea]